MYLLNQLTHADNDFMEFVLSPVAWRFEHFMKKHRKKKQRVYLSQRVAFQLPMVDFL